MSTAQGVNSTEFEDLKANFIISVCVLGGVCIILLVSVIGLFIWTKKLSKEIEKLDPFVNFKLQRPKLFTDEETLESSRNAYENETPTYPRNPSNHPEKRDLNPIALRSKASFDNGNFTFDAPTNRSSNSSLRPHYLLDHDNRFY